MSAYHRTLSPCLCDVISMVPVCSIQRVPIMMLCTTQLTFVQVYTSPSPRSTVSTPLGWNSRLLPQNLVLGYIEPRKTNLFSPVDSA